MSVEVQESGEAVLERDPTPVRLTWTCHFP